MLKLIVMFINVNLHGDGMLISVWPKSSRYILSQHARSVSFSRFFTLVPISVVQPSTATIGFIGQGISARL